MKIMLPNFIGMIFMGIMVLLVGAIYFRYGRRVLWDSVAESERYEDAPIPRYYVHNEEDEFDGMGLDRTMIRGLEETKFFRPEQEENLALGDAMQNTLVMPMTGKDRRNQAESIAASEFEAEPVEMDLLSAVEKAAGAAMEPEGPVMPGLETMAPPEGISAPPIQPTEARKKILGKNDPQPFGSQTCWVAIHTKHMKEVADILEIEGAHSCDWESGLAASAQNDGSVFVTPAIGDWVLVIGRSILKKVGLDYPIDGFKWMKEVSEQFGLVYYFCTHQKAQYQAWIKADKGEVERAYAYSGKENEVFWEWGDMTNTEAALLRSLEAVYGNQVIDEAVVLALAAKWTVDTSFRNVTNVSGPGLLGVLN